MKNDYNIINSACTTVHNAFTSIKKVDDKWNITFGGIELIGELGYKVFNPDWTCRGMSYQVGGVYEMHEEPRLCWRGFHYCKRAADCFGYYSFNPCNKVALILAYGAVHNDGGDKSCTNKIAILREIPWQELLEIVNEGEGNTGRNNTGNRNTGNHNTGNHNTGYRNWADRCSGDYNIANDSSGVFCTEVETVRIFDMDSSMTLREWRNSEACYLLSQVEMHSTIWVNAWEMTEEEKKKNPHWEVLGGYLKYVPNDPMRFAKWWNSLTVNSRNVIMNIPNFNADKFKLITGIDVNGSSAHTHCYGE